ncbi:Chaperone endoplasmic reticulum protein-folding [Penicillium cf. griseofulvum]|uniref:Protein ROT1 n=1 Tax=Penicillium cf. griseofulvum TaxID=2972120 RepID=A0A9W9M937_9EURO|nr:Chaperone endoplasmic reticulum protein-folding [Penicillium cf. griseofulvum]KAJ5445074.1 Chaperone endoplasmic reticulum protein-folding [Penicillium cf. griseofulvum]KAJ5446792.1 Chaperone endoplasmic reticulum protein-folding [Penicillium cf. griseofulvum]
MLFIYLLVTATLANANDLFGTWTTKSRDVFTGPGFYDPLNDKLIEPNLTGISYSFDDDGNYESAYYRAISNPTDPSCPGGIMQWQHGSYTVFGNGTLILTPIAVDGRQLLSDPCRKQSGHYTRYNTTEEFKEVTVEIDKFNRIKRLDLTRADGSTVNPMFLAYQPPKMLPTTTLNPTPAGNKQKRELPSTSGFQLTVREQLINPDRWWWLGVLMTSLGGVAFFCS